VQTVLQFLSLSSFIDEVLDYFQFVSIARFEPARVVKDKPVSCRILKIIFDVVFSALGNNAESIITDVVPWDTHQGGRLQLWLNLNRVTKEGGKRHGRLSHKHKTHLVTVLVETIRFAIFGMAHLVQNGCLSGVGVADDQDSKMLD